MVRAVESITGGQFQSEGFTLSYFPTLQGEFRNVSLTIKAPSEAVFRADKVKILFGFLGFIFSKPDLSEVGADGASFHAVMPSRLPFHSLDAENISIKARMIQSFNKIQLQWNGDLEGVKRSFAGKFILGSQDPLKKNWNDVFLSGDLWLKEFPLEILKNSFLEEQHIQIKSGRVNAQYRLQKEKQDPWIYANGRVHAADLVYEIQDGASKLRTPSSLVDSEMEIGWQAIDEQLSVKRTVIQMPFGKIQTSGRLLAANHEIKDARVTVSDLKLELLPQYYLPFREAVPFNLGFSGNSVLEMSLEGAFDHLSFHGNWDLGPTFLNYGNFFSKPKMVPCDLSFDLILKNSQQLNGDFSLKLSGAGFKGALSNFNIKKGEGDLNLLSNKFAVESWAPLLPVFSEYQLGGDIKALANFSGSLLRHPQEVKTMVNVILEKGTIKKGEDALKGIYFALDYSPLSFELKEGQVLAGDYPVFFNGVVFDPKTFPRAKLNLHSEKADVSKLLTSIDAVGKKWLTHEMRQMLERISPAVLNLIPEGTTLNNIQAEIESKDKQITLNELKCGIYDGQLTLKGKVTPGDSARLYSGALTIDGLSLAKFFERSSKQTKLMEGNFFAEGEFEGKDLSEENWQKTFSGKGRISVTNGEFYTFGLMKTISNISVFSLLLPKAPETTPFDDFQTEVKLAEGRVTSEKALLISRDIKAEGGGEISFGGLLNYRFNAYLSGTVLKDFAGGFLGTGTEGKEEFLGPIPMLLSGDWDQPELKTDPSKIAEFTENFTKKKAQKVLRNFLPEDVLFKRPSKS